MAGVVKSRKLMAKSLGFRNISVFVFFLMIVLTGCTNPGPNNDYYSNLSTEQKKAELRRSLEKNFEDSQTHFLLGQLYQADKAWDDAEYQYNLALRFDPVYRPAQAAMVKLLLDRGDPVKAQHYLETYMNQVKDSPDKLVGLGVEFQRQQLDNYALDCFQKALELAPNSPIAHNYLGYFYLSKNEKDKAREYFEQSFNLDRNQPVIAHELGLLDVPVEYDGPVPETIAAEN